MGRKLIMEVQSIWIRIFRNITMRYFCNYIKYLLTQFTLSRRRGLDNALLWDVRGVVLYDSYRFENQSSRKESHEV